MATQNFCVQSKKRGDMRKLVLLMVCLMQPLWFVGCGDEAPPAQVQGNWYATLTSTSISGSQGEVNLFIRQTGNTLYASPVGVYNFGGSWCLQGGGDIMTGTVNGNKVDLTIQVGAGLGLKLRGTLSNGVLTGTYTTIGSCGNGDAGIFSTVLSPPVTSSSWVGTTSFPGGSADFTANLSESSMGKVTGSITFSNSPCVTTVDVVGDHWGRLVTMTDTNGTAIDMWGSIDTSGTTISGYQLLQGSSICGFDGYTMSRP